MIAVFERHKSLVELLVLNGADVNNEDQFGNTALHIILGLFGDASLNNHEDSGPSPLINEVSP